MANLLGQNIGTNYKGILNLDTLNTPLDATLRAVTDGEGNASPLQLSTTAVSVGAISGARLGIKGSGNDATTTALLVQNSDGLELLSLDDIGGVRLGGTGNTTTKANIKLDAYTGLFNVTSAKFGNWNGSVYAVFTGLGKGDALFSFGNDATIASTRMHIKGIGTTSATTALLVQNSAGTDILKITDDTLVTFSGPVKSLRNYVDLSINYSSQSNTTIIPSALGWSIQYTGATSNIQIGRTGFIGSKEASASLQVDATTQGFLPPRMTTTEKNAIATPASGLIVYDTTTNKLSCYNGTTWNDLF